MNSGSTSSDPAGGAWGAGGYEFQHDVAALLASRAVAGTTPTDPHLQACFDSAIRALYFEARAEVDDLVVVLDSGARLFVQAKSKVRCLSDPHSRFAHAVRQFVRQYLRGDRPDLGRVGRPFDAARDYLLLAVGPGTPRTIARELRDELLVLATLPPEDPVTAAGHRRLTVLLTHMRAAWAQQLGSEPDERELRVLLTRVRVWPHLVEPRARTLDVVRREVVLSPSDAHNALTTLADEAARGAVMRWAATPAKLRRLLQERAGIALQGDVRVRADLATLAELADRASRHLARHAALRPGRGVELRVRREATDEVLRAVQAGESTLVVGAPGAGKSGVLHQVAEELRSRQDRLVVVLEAEPGSPCSLRELRARLTHSFESVLAGAGGARPPVVLLDALDSVRTPSAQREMVDALHDLVDSDARPVVVASVRTYYLRFRGTVRRAFARDVRVGALSERELTALREQWQPLDRLLAQRGSGTLLTNVFRLRIACELLDEGVEVEELTALDAPADLLDRYWELRVTETDHGRQETGLVAVAHRQRAATALARAIADQLRLTVPLDPLELEPVGLEDLLRSGVLRATDDGAALSFSHHALADHALERALLRSEDQLDQVLRDPGVLPLFLAPALRSRLARLWRVDDTRARFWSVVARNLDSGQVAPSVEVFLLAAGLDRAHVAEDVNQLLPALVAVGARAVRRGLACVVTALRADGERAALLGSGAGPWAHLAARAAASASVAPPDAVSLLGVLVPRSPPGEWTPTPAQAEQLVHAALSLLGRLAGPDGEGLHRVAFQIPTRTLIRFHRHAPERAARKIRAILAAARAGEDFLHHLHTLVREVESLLEEHVELATEIYEVTFGLPEASEERVSHGGRVLSFTATRRQELEGLRYHLRSEFHRLVDTSPVAALRTLSRVATARTRVYSDEPEASFTFRDRDVVLRRDDSIFWGHLGQAHDDVERMVEVYFEVWGRMLAKSPDRAEPEAVLDVFADEVTVPGLWRGLLQCAAAHDAIGARDVEAVSAALGGSDQDRFNVEVTTSTIDADYWLRRAGVDPDTAAHRAVRAATASLETAIVESKESGSAAGWDSVATRARELQAVLDVQIEDLDTFVRQQALAAVARGWTRVMERAGAALSQDELAEIDAALVSTVGLARPAPEPDSETVVEARPSQTTRFASSDAAVGLCVLGSICGLSSAAERALVALSTDPAPEVRYQVVRGLPWIRRLHPQLFDGLVDARAREEQSQRVLAELMTGAVWLQVESNPAPWLECLDRVLKRLGGWSGRDPLGRIIGSWVRDMHLRTGAPECEAWIDRILDRFEEDPESVANLAQFDRDWLALADDIELRPGRSARAVREAAFALAARVAAIVPSRLDALLERPEPEEPDAQESYVEDWRRAARPLGVVTAALYFGSGAHAYQGCRLKEAPKLDDARRRRFWRECKRTLQALNVPVHCEHDLHHLVRFVASYADTFPEEALDRLLRLAEADSGPRYLSDQLGGPLVAQVCEHYMLEHPDCLTKGQNQRSVLALLDLVTEAGWPDGVRLAQRLHEVWR